MLETVELRAKRVIVKENLTTLERPRAEGLGETTYVKKNSLRQQKIKKESAA